MDSKQSKKRKQTGDDRPNKTDPKKRAHKMKTRSMTKYDDTSIKDLPQEVIMEIFSRLPLLSIMKLRLVFPSIMQLPEFEHMYGLNNSPRRSTLFVTYSESLENYQMIEYRHDDHDIVSTKLDFTKLCNEHEYSSPKIVGCCNGLLLLSSTIHDEQIDDGWRGRIETLYLVNPITRSSVKLPHFKEYAAVSRYYGLGYSSRTRVYKVVSLNFDTNLKSIEILTVDVNNAENNSWRSCSSIASIKNQLSYRELSRLVSSLESPLHLYGAIHWLLAGTKLLRFHVDEEIFDLVPLPPYDKYYTRLSALSGSICVLEEGRWLISRPYGVDVWVMKEYGVIESWRILTTINLRSESTTLEVITVLEDGDLLLRVDSLLRLYDPNYKYNKWAEEDESSRVNMNDHDDVICTSDFAPNFLYLTGRSF